MEDTRSELEFVSVSEIDFFDEKIKEEDLQLYEKLKACISKRGQLRTVLVCINNETNRYECLEGVKIVRALKELNIATARAIIIKDLHLSESDKKQIRIEMSRDYFLTNYVLLGEMLKEISKTQKLNELCATIPFDTRQVQNLIAMTEFDWDAFTQNKQAEGQINMFGTVEVDEVFEESATLDKQAEHTDWEEEKTEPVVEEKSLHETMVEKMEQVVVEEEKMQFPEITQTYVLTIENKNPDDKVVLLGTPPQSDLPHVVIDINKTYEIDGFTEIEIPKILFDEMEAERIENEIIENTASKQEIEEGERKLNEILDSKPTAVQEPYHEPAPIVDLSPDDPFYIDEIKKVLVIRQYAEIILANIPYIAEQLLIKKGYENGIDKERLNISKQVNGDETIITHVIYVSRFDVKYTLILQDVFDYLCKIDFEEDDDEI